MLCRSSQRRRARWSTLRCSAGFQLVPNSSLSSPLLKCINTSRKHSRDFQLFHIRHCWSCSLSNGARKEVPPKEPLRSSVGIGDFPMNSPHRFALQLLRSHFTFLRQSLPIRGNPLGMYRCCYAFCLIFLKTRHPSESNRAPD